MDTLLKPYMEPQDGSFQYIECHLPEQVFEVPGLISKGVGHQPRFVCLFGMMLAIQNFVI